MRRVLALVFATMLPGDGSPGDGGSSSTPPNLTRSFTFPDLSGWTITQLTTGLPPQPLEGNGFDFPVCASANVCWVSYVEMPWSTPLTGRASISLSYTIIGTDPVFNNTTYDNTCGGPPALSLFIHQAGDNLSGIGPYAFYRWFSKLELAQPLKLGEYTITVSLKASNWIPVYSSTPDANAAGFDSAIANIGSVGFILGGGCFSGHGVSITSGSARLTINSIDVQ